MQLDHSSAKFKNNVLDKQIPRTRGEVFIITI